MANIEKRPNNTYRIVVSVGYNNKGQKIRKYLTITLDPNKFKTENQIDKELNRLATLFEEEVKNGTYLDGSKTTFAAFTEKWLTEYAEKKLTPGTLKPYKYRLNERILPAIGHIKLGKLKPHHIVEFLNNLGEDGIRHDGRYTPTEPLVNFLEKYTTQQLVDISEISFKTIQRIKQGESTTKGTAEKLCASIDKDIKKMFTYKNDKKLSDKTIRSHHGIISSILSTAVKWNVIHSNPAERVDLGKLKKYKPDYYDDEQVAAMFVALENEPLRYKTMVYFSIDTGLRSSEVMGICWQNIDLDKGIVTVNQQRQYVSGYGTFEANPKTDNAFRTITLSETVTDMLRDYKNSQSENMLRFGTAWNGSNSDVVFVHEDGTPFHPQLPYKWFTGFLERHNLPKITYHQLRHTNASLLISAGIDIVTLSGRLGHGDKNITLNTYSHIIKSREAQVANKMDMFYSQNKTQADK